MTSKRSGSKAKSGAGAKAGKRTTKKGSLRDLPAKDSQKIRGGVTTSGFTITKPSDSTSPKLFS
jgi:type VI protein secretion system component Hcp